MPFATDIDHSRRRMHTVATGPLTFAGAGTVALLHIWKRNMLLSIVGGTMVCVTLANLL